MKIENLNRAVAEARRFIEIAEQVKLKRVYGKGSMAGRNWLIIVDNCKETAATKRASMDLSRALSDLRRP